MGTRVFSDDPQIAADLSIAFKKGVDQSEVITTYKHFPGAGDGSDYPTSIPLTLEELQASGLAAYSKVIDQGAEMVMTSATTFPLIDEQYLMADGKTKGYYPATLSHMIVTKMLREELGFDGVVITDALEMEQFVTEPDNQQNLFSGEKESIEHDVQVAEKSINAGCDILLIPIDLAWKDRIKYYDEYIAGIAALVNDGTISMERIDESVRRILELKERHGMLKMILDDSNLDQQIEAALKIVGSAEHHAVEMDIARQAITCLKNEGVLPLSGKGSNIVIAARSYYDNTPVTYALNQLLDEGIIDENAQIENRISGETRGDENAETNIIIDSYYDIDNGELKYSDELSTAIKEADTVLCLSTVFEGIDQLQHTNPTMQGVSRALSDAREGQTKFVLLSDNLPVDVTRLQDADAIVCAYLSSGFWVDPTEHTTGSQNVGAFNANVPAAIDAIFGRDEMTGKLPISIPVLAKGPDGTWAYTDEWLYQ